MKSIVKIEKKKKSARVMNGKLFMTFLKKK